MLNNLVIIFQSINTIHELEKEFSKRFGWLRFKEKKECKKLKESIEKSINDLYNDRWTIKYLCELQDTLLAFSSVIEKYSQDFLYISDRNNNQDENTRIWHFKTLYFIDQEKEDRLISLEIVSNNISFRIIDTKTGNSFESSSMDEVQPTQKKIESVCKHCLVQMMLTYLKEN